MYTMKVTRALLLPFVCLLLSQETLAHGDLHLRISRLSERIRKEPKNASLFLKRGDLRAHHEEWDASLADYDQAIKLDSSLTVAHLGKAHVFFSSGQIEKARASIEQYLLSKKDDPKGLLLRARIRSRQGDAEGSVQDYNQALPQLTEALPDIYLERAEQQTKLGAAGAKAAVEGLDEGMKRIGKVLPLQLRAIELEVQNRNPENALNRLNEILSAAPRKEEWYFRKGELLEGMGREAEAREAWKASRAEIDRLPQRAKNSPAIQELKKKLDAAEARK